MQRFLAAREMRVKCPRECPDHSLPFVVLTDKETQGITFNKDNSVNSRLYDFTRVSLSYLVESNTSMYLATTATFNWFTTPFIFANPFKMYQSLTALRYNFSFMYSFYHS